MKKAPQYGFGSGGFFDSFFPVVTTLASPRCAPDLRAWGN